MTLKHLRYKLMAYVWKRRGRIPDAYGSTAAKWFAIEHAIRAGDGQVNGGAGIDERVVEYGWIFHRMRELNRGGEGARVLDAGSILNHKSIIDAWKAQVRSPVSIVTRSYEGRADVSTEVRYEFADLRALPYRDEWFSAVICISTMEHVGLDNTIYGATMGLDADPTAECVKAMQELRRVTRPGAVMLLSVPFGRRSNRRWFRVFDAVDLATLLAESGWSHVGSRYARATQEGWRECSQEDAASAGYNEPLDRGGERTAPSYVAAAEAVALIELTRA